MRPGVPPRLRAGGELRVIAPARSLSIVATETIGRAAERLRTHGLRVSYGASVLPDPPAPVATERRAADLHDAFADDRVDGILTAIGGYNSNQVLDLLDYELIAAHPKVFCGYSDVTVLLNAIFAKTGLVTYHGPHYSTLGLTEHDDYTAAAFRRCTFDQEPIDLVPAPAWSDDPWQTADADRRFHPGGHNLVVNEGEAEGTIVGGNLCTFLLLKGTPYLPRVADPILFFEEVASVAPTPAMVDRMLQSILHDPAFDGLRGIVIGRFAREAAMTPEVLRDIIHTKPRLRHVPVIAGADFGHTLPMFTFPIGGRARIRAAGSSASIRLLVH